MYRGHWCIPGAWQVVKLDKHLLNGMKSGVGFALESGFILLWS